MEIDKYMSIKISDFIPANGQDFRLKFDDLGILKNVSFFYNY